MKKILALLLAAMMVIPMAACGANNTGGDSAGLCREMNGAFAGRGGGRPPLAQGSLHGEFAAVQGWFAARCDESFNH